MTDTPATETVVDEPEAPKTFTQEDVNRINATDRRKDREMIAALQAQLDELKPKAQRADELEAAQLTAAERAERERDEARARLQELEQRVKAAERRDAATAAAMKVAKELGVSPDAALVFADRLKGDDAETMEADAREVLAHLKPSEAPAPPAANDSLTPAPSDESRYVESLKAGDIAGAIAAKNAMFPQ